MHRSLRLKAPCRILTLVHPVLFHLGSIVIPAYGALAALGVLLALFLALRTAKRAGVDPNQLWNLCIVALFAAVVGSRLLLVAVNFSALRLHPRWLLGLAMIHHPLLAVAGGAFGAVAATLYGRWQHMQLWPTLDALAAPLALALGMEQVGALMAGSGYGTPTTLPWAVTYFHPITTLWSGTPLGVPVHPVQIYAALAFFVLCLLLWFALTRRPRPGDVAGLALLGFGVAIYITEFWRDTEGRGTVLAGALDGPQAAAVVLMLVGAAILWERKPRAQAASQHGPAEKNEASDV